MSLKEEDHGRMFPVSNRAQDVVDALIRQLQRLHVEVRLHTAVNKLVMDEEKNFGCAPCRWLRNS
ncbi:NAD(P)/FAD-dependent oxidoreductase [Lysinibacillus sp. MHQ-1]|nr:NAD(P)/FAD-dependent oxidoreductase [Lysinibacillus sp. MHQ-1]